MNEGKANKAAIRLLLWSVAGLAGLYLAAWVGHVLGGVIIAYYQVFLALWAVLVVAVLYFSRDPDPVEPSDLAAIVSPAHGKVDVIEDAVENEFMKGPCKRIAIRVSLFDVQVQYAPASGTVAHIQHRPAFKEKGGTADRETLLIGFEVVGQRDARLAVRLVGGTWGRRIVPWIWSGDVIPRCTRIGMMRPASRVDLYVPSHLKLRVNAGDEVTGGQSVVGKFE
jgi:phosphatidylserine decarboxylase